MELCTFKLKLEKIRKYLPQERCSYILGNRSPKKVP